MMPSESRIGTVYLTPEELAAKTKMSLKWVRKQTQAKRIPGHVKVGRYSRYLREEVEKHAASGTFLLPALPASNYLLKRAGRLLQGDRNGH